MDKHKAISNLNEKLQEFLNTKNNDVKNINFGVYLGMLSAYRQFNIFTHEEFTSYHKKIIDVIN